MNYSFLGFWLWLYGTGYLESSIDQVLWVSSAHAENQKQNNLSHGRCIQVMEFFHLGTDLQEEMSRLKSTSDWEKKRLSEHTTSHLGQTQQADRTSD